MPLHGASECRFADGDRLAATLAAVIAAELRAAIGGRGQASLVVAGGRSPVALFRCLRRAPLDWSRVTVTLSDERFVPGDHEDSNERMVRRELLADEAGAASFVPLRGDAPTAEEAAAAAAGRLAAVPRPFDCVLLGMGTDGHTASLFPGARQLPQALAAPAAASCLAIDPPAGHRRLTLAAQTLLDARRVVLLLAGEAKWRVYLEAAAASDGAARLAMPVRAILHQTGTPVDVYWSA